MTKLFRDLKKKHQAELRALHCQEKGQLQTLSHNHRIDYEKTETEQERAILLVGYVQAVRQLRQTFVHKQQRLVAYQARQRENIIQQAAAPEQRKQMACARLILNAVAKLDQLPVNF